MDYKKLHDDFINYCQTTTPLDRLIRRSPNDLRVLHIKQYKLYTEKHHIIPKYMNGSNLKSNIVELLPEEHYLIHLIRYKAFENREDFLAVRFIVNGLKNKNYIFFKGSFLKKLGLYQNYIYNFRLKHNWQTDEGLKRISESSKNKISVKDKTTGAMIGKVSTSHPKVISGEWVHHSTGFSTYYDDTGDKVYMRVSDAKKLSYKGVIDNNGTKNPNYKEMTDERKKRLFALVPKAIVENHLIIKKLESLMKDEFTEFKRISSIWIKNNFGDYTTFIDEYNKEHNTNYIFDTYFRNKEQREFMRKLTNKKADDK